MDYTNHNQPLNDVVEDAVQPYPQLNLETIPFEVPNSPLFTFIDLFAGIGGFRIAMQNGGGNVYLPLK
ncbi:MAG: hypothetical protein RLZZ292_2532 [Bacteroidota bacterium]|jgi:DNA (cytosine-5)-methyltransferase 1